MRGLGQQHRAEGSRWQEYDLSVGQMRRQFARDVRLRGSGGGAQDQLRSTHGCGEIRREEGDCRLMPALEILDENLAAGGPMRRHRVLVAPPQPRLMAGQREVAGGGKRTVTPAKHGNAHSISLADAYPLGPSMGFSFQAELLQLAKHVVPVWVDKWATIGGCADSLSNWRPGADVIVREREVSRGHSQ